MVYPQSGWRLSDVREVGLGKNKKKRRARLYLSKIGFFTLVIHRELLLERVPRFALKCIPPVGYTWSSWWRRLKHWVKGAWAPEACGDALGEAIRKGVPKLMGRHPYEVVVTRKSVFEECVAMNI